MSKLEVIPISSLQENQRDAALELFVLRQGAPFATKRGIVIRKIIFIDSMGTMINGLIFSSALKHFENMLKSNTTCGLYYPVVKPIDGKFPNVNDKHQLYIQLGTTVTEFRNQLILPQLECNFTSFRDLRKAEESNKDYDIIGILKKVRPLVTFTRNVKDVGYKREIVLMNTSWEEMTINMWDDMALNETSILQLDGNKNAIVAFKSVQVQVYRKLLQLKTTPTTAMFINPTCVETDVIKVWLQEKQRHVDLNGGWVSEVMKTATKVTIKMLLEERNNISQSDYYYIEGSIDEIENVQNPWYEACNKCYKTVIQTPNGVDCVNCGNLNIASEPRFRVTLVVKDGKWISRMTLFEEVAESFIGCNVRDYINQGNQGSAASAFLDVMKIQSKGIHCFLFRMDSSLTVQKDIISLVLEGVVKPLTSSEKGKVKKRRRLLLSNSNPIEPDEIPVNDTTTMLDEMPIGNMLSDNETIHEYTQRLRKQKSKVI